MCANFKITCHNFGYSFDFPVIIQQRTGQLSSESHKNFYPFHVAFSPFNLDRVHSFLIFLFLKADTLYSGQGAVRQIGKLFKQPVAFSLGS